jgi:hypothetical protein
MNNDDLKSRIFAEFAAELAKDGATMENTDVIEADEVPPSAGRFIRLFRQIGGKFVSLVGKWGGLGFLLYVSVVQAVPEQRQVFVPNDHNQIITDAIMDYQKFNLHSLDLSGIAQLWIAEYGINPPKASPNREIPFRPCAGDKFILVPADWNVPANYTPTLTGQFVDYRE